MFTVQIQEELKMTLENMSETEIRKLQPGSLFKLCQYLECGEGWKQLMSVIPLGCREGNPPKYTVDDMKLIETAGMCQKRQYSEILLEEWGTSGKCRPTVSFLLKCLLKAELYRAADYVAVELLKGPRPPRPERGPAAEVKYPTSESFLPTAPPPCIQSDRAEVLNLRFSDLELATKRWSDTELLGCGGWGTVYRACLPQLGVVAVKRLHHNSISGDPQRQFENEVRVLSQLSHPHLLPLLGYSHDGPIMCLAYKYMKFGSLMDRLACKAYQAPLPWRTRLEIGLGTARGIAHLHMALPSPLVHRDVKSANILLDDNLTPKLGDFGLVRHGSNGNITTMTKTAIGTSAYMAPEALRGDVSVKMDVFSFGVVLLELLTGLPPLDETREGHDLITHVEDADDKEALVDRKAGNWPPEIITNMFELISTCLLEKRRRPFISDVIDKIDMYLQ